MKGAPARRVVDCRPTVGPAELDACGAEPLPKAPTNVSDGHGRVPLSGSPCSAQESPAFRHGEWSTIPAVDMRIMIVGHASNNRSPRQYYQ